MEIMKGRVVLFGIGSLLRGDDAAGPVLVELLRGRTGAVCINAENAPEKYVGKVLSENPDTVIIVDAVHMNTEAGGYRVFRPEELAGAGITTHDIPLGELLNYLRQESGADVWVLGIQPERLEIEEGLSSRVKKSIEGLVNLFLEASPG